MFEISLESPVPVVTAGSPNLHEIHMHDPALSANGRTQCATLQEHLRKDLPLADQVELIVASPMTRTLETAHLALSWLIERGVPILPRAEFQEFSDNPCDIGSHTSMLEKTWPKLDFSGLHPQWPSKNGDFAYDKDAVLQRGADCRAWLKSRPEKVIAVVSHASFLRIGIANAQFGNADYRVVEFVDDSNDALVTEWPLTVENGGGLGQSRKDMRGIVPGDFPRSRAQQRTL